MRQSPAKSPANEPELAPLAPSPIGQCCKPLLHSLLAFATQTQLTSTPSQATIASSSLQRRSELAFKSDSPARIHSSPPPLAPMSVASRFVQSAGTALRHGRPLDVIRSTVSPSSFPIRSFTESAARSDRQVAWSGKEHSNSMETNSANKTTQEGQRGHT